MANNVNGPKCLRATWKRREITSASVVNRSQLDATRLFFRGTRLTYNQENTKRNINKNNRKDGKKKPVGKEMTNPMSGVSVNMGNGDVSRREGGDHRRREGSGPRSAHWNTVASGGSWPWSVTGES